MQHSWGKGYATEATKKILQTLAQLPEHKIFSAIALPDNHASITVMKKLGMNYVKTYIHHDDQMSSDEVVLYQLENKR